MDAKREREEIERKYVLYVCYICDAPNHVYLICVAVKYIEVDLREWEEKKKHFGLPFFEIESDNGKSYNIK